MSDEEARVALDPQGAPTRRWGIGDAVGGLLVVLAISSVAVLVGLGVAGIPQDEIDELPLWAMTLLQVPMWVGFAGVPWWVSRRKGSGSLAVDFGLRMRARDIWVGLSVGFASQLLLGLFLLPVYDLFGIETDDVGETAQALADRADDPLSVVFLVVGAVFGASFFEELFFRGLVLRAVLYRAGPVIAVVASSLLFGLIHFQPADTIALAAFGAVCGTLAVRAGRLGPAIWAHLAFNLTAVVSLLYL